MKRHFQREAITLNTTLYLQQLVQQWARFHNSVPVTSYTTYWSTWVTLQGPPTSWFSQLQCSTQFLLTWTKIYPFPFPMVLTDHIICNPSLKLMQSNHLSVHMNVILAPWKWRQHICTLLWNSRTTYKPMCQNLENHHVNTYPRKHENL
jgi:hypothetical protein